MSEQQTTAITAPYRMTHDEWSCCDMCGEPSANLVEMREVKVSDRPRVNVPVCFDCFHRIHQTKETSTWPR